MDFEHQGGAAGSAPVFAALLPEQVLSAVESATGGRCAGICRPLNSYINRVYEVGLEQGGSVIVKFYRPGRWSPAALRDELDFVAELHADEIPVVPPLPGPDGRLLHDFEGISFAVFPKRGGRPLDEPSDREWLQLGRLIGRMHSVGARRPADNRIRLHPLHSTARHLDYIMESGLVTPAFRSGYEKTVNGIIGIIAPMFEAADSLRIHADCHRGNILYRPDEGYHLLDFDDMAMGPAVQDLWLLLPDRLRQARREAELLMEGHDTFMPFPRETLRLIEPLRAMRFIHYTAWCAIQKTDRGFSKLAPHWGTQAFWRQEIADLETQRQEILDAANG